MIKSQNKIIQLLKNNSSLRSYKPHERKLDNFIFHCDNFDNDMLELLESEDIAAHDKIMIATLLLPCTLIEIFTVDCLMSAALRIDAYGILTFDNEYGLSTIDFINTEAVASYAMDAASYTNDSGQVERENQVDALIMLFKLELKKN